MTYNQICTFELHVCIILSQKGGNGMEYVKPVMVVIDLTDDEALVAMARCNGGAWTSGGCS